MIKNFQLLIHQVLDNVELNEKTFRDHGSGFVVVKKNYKFREKLFKKTDFPKIKTIPKYLNKSWGKGKVCYAFTVRSEHLNEKSSKG